MNSPCNSQVSNAIADGSYTYQEVLNLLDNVAAGGVTASEWSDLKTVYGNSTALFASDYVKTITYNVVYSNPANALWWGGAKTYGGVATLGDLSGRVNSFTNKCCFESTAHYAMLDTPLHTRYKPGYASRSIKQHRFVRISSSPSRTARRAALQRTDGAASLLG